MNHALQAYNIMTSLFPDDTPQWSTNLVHTHLFYHIAQAKQAHGSLVLGDVVATCVDIQTEL